MDESLLHNNPELEVFRSWSETEVDSEGVKTIVAHSQAAASGATDRTPKFYCSWFCPYAQRAWIGLEELEVDYKYVEINPYYKAEDGKGYTKLKLPLAQKPRDFVAVSPHGLVPALLHQGRGFHDSIPLLYYINDSFATANHSLMPSSASECFEVRLWVAFIDSRVIPFFYKILMTQEEELREEHKQTLTAALRELSAGFQKVSPSGYFLGESQFSILDIILAPWFYRLRCVLTHYTGFVLPESKEFDRLRSWWSAVSARPSVRRTLVSETQLTLNYTGYANNTATSTVALDFREKKKLKALK